MLTTDRTVGFVVLFFAVVTRRAPAVFFRGAVLLLFDVAVALAFPVVFPAAFLFGDFAPPIAFLFFAELVRALPAAAFRAVPRALPAAAFFAVAFGFEAVVVCFFLEAVDALPLVVFFFDDAADADVFRGEPPVVFFPVERAPLVFLAVDFVALGDVFFFAAGFAFEVDLDDVLFFDGVFDAVFFFVAMRSSQDQK